MKRTDIHAPSKIVPDEYEHLCCYALPTSHDGWPIPGWNLDLVARHLRERGHGGVHSGTGSCDVCGAQFIYGELWLHKPSGHAVKLGHECAEKYELLCDRSEARNVRATALIRAEKEARRAWMRKQMKEHLQTNPGLGDAFRVARRNRIVADIRARFIQWGSISTAQIALVRKIAAEITSPAVEKVPTPEGRTAVEGTIVSLKVQPSDFGETLKMLVVVATPAGEWRCWSTCPRWTRVRMEKGMHVRFRATLKRSRDDISFAFASRPTNMEVL